jgi:LmbE family N-acetylglucosaminyl deacetylase
MLLIISPHLDDAVFSCGALMAATPGAVVCTVFAGVPQANVATDWDRRCGFADAHQAMRSRREEDTAALDALNAKPIHLDFLDAQYVPPEASAPTQAIADALNDAIRRVRPGTLYIPLAMFHSDHRLTHEAARVAWQRNAELPCIAYEDCLYRRMEGRVQTRLSELASDGIVATPWFDIACTEQAQARKRIAVSRYVSQLEAFGPNGYDDVFAPERAWTLQNTR